MEESGLENVDAAVRATVLSAYTAMAESNKNRRLNLFTVTPVGSIIAMVGTIWGGTSNEALSNLSVAIGIFGTLLIIGLFFSALGATRHDKEYQTVITALAVSLHLPVPEMSIHSARMIISFLFASSIGCMVCIATWFAVPGFGIILALIGAVIAGVIAAVVRA